MEEKSAVLDICAGSSPVPGEFRAQRPVTQSFDVCFDLCLHKRLIKQSWGWWFETLSRPLWRHCNDLRGFEVLQFHFDYGAITPGYRMLNIWLRCFTKIRINANICIVYISVTKGPVTQRFTVWSRPKSVKKLSPVKQTMLFALMSSLRRATVDL